MEHRRADDRVCKFHTTNPVPFSFHFHLNLAGSDCAYDYLNFYEGRDSSGRLLGSFCDSIVPDQIETFSPVFVVFHTDGDTGGNGFGFRYEPGENQILTDTNYFTLMAWSLSPPTYRHP